MVNIDMPTWIPTTPNQSPSYKINDFFSLDFLITLAWWGGGSVFILSKLHSNKNITLHVSPCQHNTHHCGRYKGKLNRVWLQCLKYHPFPILTSTNCDYNVAL